MMHYKPITIITLIFAVTLLFAPFAFADFLDVGADMIVRTNSTVFVIGAVRLDNFSGISNVNVSVNLNGTTNFTTTGADGSFYLNVTSPLTPGNYSINVTTNTSLSKLLPVHVRNISSATITFIANKPPFSNGTSFLVNVTFDGTPLSAPVLRVFNPNGNISTGWTITNVTAANQSVITYNVTVPAAADGEYALVVEEGAGFLFFIVKSSVTLAVDIQDNDNATETSFAPSETVNIVAKVRDSSGPITTASVTALVTLPNETVRNTSLTHSSVTNGTYKAAFTETSATGMYNVKIIATVSGRTIEGSSFFTTQNIEGKLDIVKDFFFEFGGSSAFSAGGQVAFNVLIFNMANDETIPGAANGDTGLVNCSSLTPVQFKNVLTGTTITFNSSNITTSLGNFFGQDVCKINFTAPQTNGIYMLSVNATVGHVNNATTLASGYFSVQSYVLKVSPISSIGGGKDFMSSLIPGDNATFEISARNLSANGTAVNASSITDISVTRISSLNFLAGNEPDITSITYNVTSGTDSTNPKVIVTLPENKTGPFNIEFQASVGGNIIRGTSFYFAKYIDGFVFPAGFFGFGEGPGGGGGGGDSSAAFRCSGTRTFQAKTFDVRTRQPAKNVVFNSIQEAREEMTGRSILSFLSINSSTVSDNNGEANITITFSPSTTYSGFYFFLLNVTTGDGKNDIMPGGFECRSLNFFPSISAIGGGGFNVAPGASLNISVSSITNIATALPSTVRNGSVRIMALENFDPAKGPKFYPGPAASFPLFNGSVSFTLVPSNLSLTRWPSGFGNLRVQVCDNSTSPETCDVGFGGFRVVAFDAFFDFSMPLPNQVAPLDNVSFIIDARTNVTRNSGNYSSPDLGWNTTTTGFRATVGLPWEGAVVETTATGTLMQDNWNSSSDLGSERWNVTFTVPAGVRKGGNMLQIEVKNYLNDTTTVDYFFQVMKNSIFVPDGEGVLMQNFGVDYDSTNMQPLGFNITALNTTQYGNLTSRSGRVCTRTNLTATRFGPFQQTIQYNNVSIANVTVMIIDNATAGVYDTVVINKSSDANYTVAAAGQQLGPAFGGLYVRKINGCEFFEIINSTATTSGFGSGFGGQHQKGTNFTIPFIVRQGSTPVSGVTVDIAQIVLQSDFGGGRGGFGFEGFLSASNFTKTPVVTDLNGVAFLRLNVTVSGSYGLIWNVSAAGEVDTAEFSQVVPIEIRTFDTSGSISQRVPRAVTLTKNTSSVIWNTSSINGYYVFNATWNESAQGPLTDDGTNTFFYIVLRNVSFDQMTNNLADVGTNYTNVLIDDDNNLNEIFPRTEEGFEIESGNWTSQITIGSGGVDDLFVDGNRTIDENTTQLLFSQGESGGSMFGIFLPNSGSSTRVDANVTVRVCARTFDRPQRPVIGASIVLQVDKFTGFGPPTLENLTMYNPFTNVNVSSILTGPSGCATFNVSRIDSDGTRGWSSGMPNNIKGRITSGSDTENVFVGSVSVACPSSGPCF